MPRYDALSLKPKSNGLRIFPNSKFRIFPWLTILVLLVASSSLVPNSATPAHGQTAPTIALTASPSASVPEGTTVTITATTSVPVGDLWIFDTTVPVVEGYGPYVAACNSALPSSTVIQCSGRVIHTPGTIQFLDGPDAGTYPTNATVHRFLAQWSTATGSGQAIVYVTWGTSGTTTCGQTLGQHCTAIWTDKTQYQVGDTVNYCYSVPYATRVRITDYAPDGTSQVVADGNDDGTGACGTGTITPPTGTERLHIDVFDRTTGTNVVAQADTSFTVAGSSCSPTCQVSLTTDKTQYSVGDTIQVCFNPRVPSHVRITFTPPGGSPGVLYDQDDDGTGACFAGGTASLPAGTRSLHMDVTQGTVVIGRADAQYSVLAPPPTCTPGNPGGSWQSPSDGITSTGALHFAATAGPSNSCSAAINRVQFTAWWPSLGPKSGPWIVACAVASPNSGSSGYACDVDLAHLNGPNGQVSAPAGQVWISFDVYDQAGHSTLSPGSERTITYLPPTTPTPTPPPPPVVPRTVVVFVPGIGTHIDGMAVPPGDRCPSPTGDSTFAGIQSAFLSSGLDCSNFLWYSYEGGSVDGNGNWNLNPYSCYDTGDHVDYSVGMLTKMLSDYYARNPHTRFVLIGHSLGGVVALQASIHAPPGSVSRVITIDSPLKHASGHNRRTFLQAVNRAEIKAGQQILAPCAKVLWDSDSSRDLGNIDNTSTRSRYGDEAEQAVSQGKSQKIGYMTIGNSSDCVWDPAVCGLQGSWRDDRGSMVVHSANVSKLYDLGTDNCNLSDVNPQKTKNPLKLAKLSCVADPHAVALTDKGTQQDIVHFSRQP